MKQPLKMFASSKTIIKENPHRNTKRGPMHNLSRVRQVINTLNTHGLGAIAIRAGFSWYLPLPSRFQRKTPSDVPVRLRKAAEELGGTFIKLGQMLSLRPDLIPQEYCDEFSKLLDEVPAEPIETIIPEIERGLKKPARAVFSHIDHAPLGSASIAQVHKARLKDGTAVAVKVRRPNIKEQIEADLSILRLFAHRLEKYAPELNPSRIASEFERYTEQELNLVAEGHALETVRKTTKNRNVIIPQVHWKQTAENILTLDFLEGTKLSETKHAPAKHAETIVNTLLDQIFTAGTFHADLHPGNVLALKNGKLGLLDFGIVGHIDARTRDLGLKLALSILGKDHREIAETLLAYGQASADTDIDAFRTAVQHQLDLWWRDPKPSVNRLMYNLFITSAKHHILLPQDTILIGKALITAESTAKILNPQYDYLRDASPKLAEILKTQRAPKAVIARLTSQAKHTAEILRDIPEKTLEALDAVRSGRFSVQLKDTEFRHLGKDINLSSNRLSFALVAAACIIASTALVDVGPKIGTYGIMSIFSLVVASIFVLLLFISVTREHHPVHDPH